MSVSHIVSYLKAKIPVTVATGAAGAIGTLLVTTGTPYAWNHLFNQKHLVVAFRDTPDTPVNACPITKKTDAKPRITNIPDGLNVEFWDISQNGSYAQGSVRSNDGTGHASISGRVLLKDGVVPIDTMTMETKGDIAGRGTYFMRRDYIDDNVNTPATAWMYGVQVLYDCSNHTTWACPAVAGEAGVLSLMTNDPYLALKCVNWTRPADMVTTSALALRQSGVTEFTKSPTEKELSDIMRL